MSKATQSGSCQFRKIVSAPTCKYKGAAYLHPDQYDFCSHGVIKEVVQERLGHSNLGVTMDTYSHVAPGSTEERKLNNAIDDYLVESGDSFLLRDARARQLGIITWEGQAQSF